MRTFFSVLAALLSTGFFPDQSNRTEQFSKYLKCYTNTNGSSVVTIFGVKILSSLQWYYVLNNFSKTMTDILRRFCLSLCFTFMLTFLSNVKMFPGLN